MYTGKVEDLERRKIEERRMRQRQKRQESNGHQSGKESGNQDTKKKKHSSQPVFAMSWEEGFAENQGKSHVHKHTPHHCSRHYLVELLRCKICTLVALVPLPTDRRRGRISLPLPLRRLRGVLPPRTEPRRRVWSKTDVSTLESRWL
jgi:hypothetical protein